MDNSDKKPPNERTSEDCPDGWDWFMATLPGGWIAALIAFAVIVILDVPDEFRRAVFYVVLIFVIMIGSVVLVYIFARSLKRGNAAPSQITTQTTEQAVARKRRAEPIP